MHLKKYRKQQVAACFCGVSQKRHFLTPLNYRICHQCPRRTVLELLLRALPRCPAGAAHLRRASAPSCTPGASQEHPSQPAAPAPRQQEAGDVAVSRFNLSEMAQELLWPTRCVVCDLPGELLCESCRAQLPWIAQREACPVCGAPFGALTCTECKKDWPTRACVCALPFAGPAARLVTSLKDGHELRLAPVMAAAMATALDEAAAWPALDGESRYNPGQLDALCYVPATREAFARRGFDHMELVARELSWVLSLPVADVLARTSAHDQRTLDRSERQANLSGTVEVIGNVSQLHLLLVDDVITTGASVCACAEALLARGAASVSACALARVW